MYYNQISLDTICKLFNIEFEKSSRAKLFCSVKYNIKIWSRGKNIRCLLTESILETQKLKNTEYISIIWGQNKSYKRMTGWQYWPG